MKKLLTALAGSILLILSMFVFAACEVKHLEPDGVYDREALAADFLEKANAVTVNEDSVTFADASGEESVTILKNPQKVANLYASFTTLWYEAGGIAKGVIGGTSSSALYIEQIGRDITLDNDVTVLATSAAASRWNIETIINSQPNLIICSTAMSGYATIKSPAEAAGIPVIAVSYDDFSDYLKWLKVFSNLTGHPELFESIALNALDEVIDVLMKAPLENNPVVFSMFTGSTDLQANLTGTVVGGMISQLRAINIADSWYNAAGASRLPINLESVYAINPEMILVQCHAEDEEVFTLIESIYGDNPVWNNMDAVKNDKIYLLQKTLFHNKPNKKFAEAYKIMAEMLYPEINFGE